MRDKVYTDAARFKQLSGILLDANYSSFPGRAQIERVTAREPGLRSWMRNYPNKHWFMREVKFFYYRERARRRPQAACRS